MNAAAPKLTEIQRITALPRRPVLDCERKRGPDGRRVWAAEAQALIEIETDHYARRRLSCDCRGRTLHALPGGRLLVFQDPPPDQPPSLPREFSVEEFCRDAIYGSDNTHDSTIVKIASSLRPGQEVRLPGLGHPICITEFNPVQAWILREAPRARGILGFVSVGGGKSLSSIMVPQAVQCRNVVLLVKSDQRFHYRKTYMRAREHFRVPTIVFDRTSLGDFFAVAGTPVVHLVPYSFLSNPKNSVFFEQLTPDMIVADELHSLAGDTARTRRFMRYMTDRPETIFCGWSGSLIKKSIRDVAHLAAHSLGIGSPYPIPTGDVLAWAAVIDPLGVPDRTSPTAKNLRRAFGLKRGDDKIFEMGFLADDGIVNNHRDWVVATPGVISTRSSSINCSIVIREVKVPPLPPAVGEAVEKARTGTRWDGEELAEAAEIALTTRAAAAGYYFYWAYPKSKPEDRIKDGLIDKWFEARKAWNKELRRKLANGEPNLDSVKLCEHAAERAWRVPRYEGDLPVWPAMTWPDWMAIRDKVEPDERSKWIDDYLAQAAAKWALENIGIVWCQSPVFGERVAKISGLPYHGGGQGAEEKILSETGKRSIIATVRSHGSGRDGLQEKFSKQLFAEVMPSGDAWQQALGRLAREGQRADTVETDVFLPVDESREAMRKAIVLAEFAEASTLNAQLLLAADLEFDL